MKDDGRRRSHTIGHVLSWNQTLVSHFVPYLGAIYLCEWPKEFVLSPMFHDEHLYSFVSGSPSSVCCLIQGLRPFQDCLILRTKTLPSDTTSTWRISGVVRSMTASGPAHGSSSTYQATGIFRPATGSREAYVTVEYPCSENS